MSEQQRVVDAAGWAWPLLAKRAHYFTTEGRSLCGGWLFTGRRDPSQGLGAAPGSDDCRACWRKAAAMQRAGAA